MNISLMLAASTIRRLRGECRLFTLLAFGVTVALLGAGFSFFGTADATKVVKPWEWRW
jgi:hypothetical protein